MNGIVKLDVGGCLYTTTRLTLTHYPDTMLAAMFSGELDPAIRDPNGAFVIDRDGPIFRHVLNFIRQGRLILPKDFNEWDQLASDADFYQVRALVDAVKNAKDATKNPKFEFIEIGQGTDMYSVKYIGSSETMANLPGFLCMLSTSLFKRINVLDVVKKEGRFETQMHKRSLPPSAWSPNCLVCFQEILNNGFELKTAPCKMEDKDGMKWTFLRKI